ncbi:MAG TPA: hypothetical protein VJ830_07755 [Anaerolineales bacterium]|nr:hypothetical protein [Anaerolineales bacterium]
MRYFAIRNSANHNAAQHSVPHDHRDKCAPNPWVGTRTVVVGLLPVGTACAFSDSLRGLRLVPAKGRSLIPPTSPRQGCRYAACATGNVSRCLAGRRAPATPPGFTRI